MIEGIKNGEPNLSIVDYQVFAVDPNFVHQANEAKKFWKRSPEAKAKIVMRGGTKIKKSTFNSKDFFDKKAKALDSFINDVGNGTELAEQEL